MVTTSSSPTTPTVVTNLVKGLAPPSDLIHNNPAQAEQLVSKRIGSDSGQELSVDLVNGVVQEHPRSPSTGARLVAQEGRGRRAVGSASSLDGSRTFALTIPQHAAHRAAKNRRSHHETSY